MVLNVPTCNHTKSVQHALHLIQARLDRVNFIISKWKLNYLLKHA